MSALLGIHSLSKSFGSQLLFEGISFTICEGDRIGLVGPNGSGKSTLLKILMGLEPQDAGSLSRRQNLRVGYASQDPEFPPLDLLSILVNEGKNQDAHELETKARILLGKAQFEDVTQKASLLSGGWKKRLDIIRALINDPDLLILDEPTNHLDLEGILWLEKFLKRERSSYVIVSHDRYFLEQVVTKVIELNRCYPEGLFIADGSMSRYYEQKRLFLEAQASRERSLASVVRDEVEWLKRSPKARTTKSVARIQRAHELIDELSDVKKRNTNTQVSIDFQASERETRKLLTCKNLSKSYGDKVLFRGIDITLTPGSCLSIMGANGTGKTTLLKILAGECAPDLGTIKYANDLRLVYFDQHREKLDPEMTLKEALCPTGEMVRYRGEHIHVNGWAKKFLFRPERLTLPVRFLSGGERARVLLAKLMLEPADILFLDEPTNDLDIPTLEIIEESLQQFAGAVVLISHDRCLVDRVSTQILGLESPQETALYADYAQWEKARQPKQKELPKTVVKQPKLPQKKLSYMEQKELASMEEHIMALEQRVHHLELEVTNTTSIELYESLASAQKTLEHAFTRWQELLDKS